MNDTDEKNITRRKFVKDGVRLLSTLAIGGSLAKMLVDRNTANNTLVWQIDPDRCVQCGLCATGCVLASSAVKCVHAFDVCGYCELCGGYSRKDAINLDTAAENQLCPTGAIQRKFIEEPYFEYVIDESLCVGCSKCVKGCDSFGNGSLYLQVSRDLCVDCNECAIARNCPAQAFKKIPASQGYILRGGKKLIG